MDNFRVRVRSEGREHFDAAMKLCFTTKYGHKHVTHYSKEANRFVLYWTPAIPDALPLPTKMNWEAAADLLWYWLTSEADYGPEPDHDGSNGKGWQICSKQGYGRHDEPQIPWQAVMELRPEWAWYGK